MKQAQTPQKKTALIMAGGTGGHIFPGLAVAQQLQSQGWQVHWVGAPASMEARIAEQNALPFEAVEFSGVRGKGFARLLRLPMQLLRALRQSRAIMRRLQPAVVVGMGGYISFPAGLAARLAGVPIFLHEQNAIAGLSNRVLAHLATQVFTAFPQVFAQGVWVGNPLRLAFTQQAAPQARYAGRTGALRILVMGGSLGAKALNTVLPQALALIPAGQRPVVIHQSGEKQIAELQANYAQAGVDATLLPFIEDVAGEMAKADLLICRAGASTVCEIAAVGVPAIFVPFPFAVDDHQSANARFLSDAGAAWLCPQSSLPPEDLAAQIQALTRAQLQQMAERAKAQEKLGAAQTMAAQCEALLV
jgi:UDP-N-acetylglucosamine--N-acetylmuramyl-(pentapeptide) pyrophosphoryl-undecaprenol N-acetylglucosamine transferase